MADKEGLLRLRTVSGMDAAEMAKLRQRAQLADRFFEVLISRRHGSAEGLTAAVSTAHFCFLPASDVAQLLQTMGEDELAQEEGCQEGMDMLHEGMYDLGDRSYVQLRRISADMMQYRRHIVDISRSSRPSEGIPRASSEDEAARTCWVGGIPNGLPAKAVEDLFGQFGEVASTTIRNKGSERGARSRPDQMLPCAAALTCAMHLFACGPTLDWRRLVGVCAVHIPGCLPRGRRCSQGQPAPPQRRGAQGEAGGHWAAAGRHGGARLRRLLPSHLGSEPQPAIESDRTGSEVPC